ncbi:putative aspartate transaminase [Aspergillus crustosus]
MEAKTRIKFESLDHEYLPLRGSPEFLQAAQILVFGPKIMRKDAKSIASIQTVSGTGPNSLIAAFLQRHTQPTNIWLPDPTWMNHVDVWKETAPAVSVKRYPYYDNATKTFNFDGMIRELANKAQANDAILLHACAHNPTGIDPSKEQWREIAQLCKTKKIFIIFDIAYQGFASGDLDLDAWAIRYFCTYPEIEMVVCQSFSKNLGLYGERTGALHITISRESSITPTAAVENHLIDLHRAIASMAPRFGCRIATEILQNEELRKTWSTDLLTMSGRIKDMRRALYEELARLGTPGNWKHIVEQTGMFSYTGLGPDEVATLKKEYHVYLLPSGRASICGLTSSIVQYTAEAIHKVVSRKLL